MKKLLLFFVLFLSAIGFAKEVPGPNVWYNLSEKILLQSYQFIGVQKDNKQLRNVKQQSIKTKTLEVTSKYQPKKQIVLPDYLGIATDTNSVWILVK